uniref:Uncharacterized protein n=1 Tax=Coturnix japonica TaxID=93934 RepID=A0A8C2SQT1_COTJA
MGLRVAMGLLWGWGSLWGCYGAAGVAMGLQKLLWGWGSLWSCYGTGGHYGAGGLYGAGRIYGGNYGGIYGAGGDLWVWEDLWGRGDLWGNLWGLYGAGVFYGSCLPPQLELLYFPKSWLTHSEQYRWFQLCYQSSVFVSRSSLRCCRFRHVWILALTQVTATLLWAVASDWLPSFGPALALVLLEGTVGGGAYANAYSNINEEVRTIGGYGGIWGYMGSMGSMG